MAEVFDGLQVGVNVCLFALYFFLSQRIGKLERTQRSPSDASEGVTSPFNASRS